MKIHHIHPETGIYCTTTDARENPREKGEFLIPANSTTKEPLKPKAGYAVVFNKDVDGWEYIEDLRFTPHWDDDGNLVEIKDLGPAPEGLLTRDPGKPFRILKEEFIAEVELESERNRRLLVPTIQPTKMQHYTDKYRNAVLHKGGGTVSVRWLRILKDEAERKNVSMEDLIDAIIEKGENVSIEAYRVSQIESTILDKVMPQKA